MSNDHRDDRPPHRARERGLEGQLKPCPRRPAGGESGRGASSDRSRPGLGARGELRWPGAHVPHASGSEGPARGTGRRRPRPARGDRRGPQPLPALRRLRRPDRRPRGRLRRRQQQLERRPAAPRPHHADLRLRSRGARQQPSAARRPRRRRRAPRPPAAADPRARAAAVRRRRPLLRRAARAHVRRGASGDGPRHGARRLDGSRTRTARDRAMACAARVRARPGRVRPSCPRWRAASPYARPSGSPRRWARSGHVRCRDHARRPSDSAAVPGARRAPVGRRWTRMQD